MRTWNADEPDLQHHEKRPRSSLLSTDPSLLRAASQDPQNWICSYVCAHAQTFPKANVSSTQRPPTSILRPSNLHARKLASEKDLESYERFAVEDHISSIVSELSKVTEARAILGLAGGVVFEHKPNSLNDSAEEVQERLRLDRSASRSQGATGTRLLYADQIRVYRKTSGVDHLLFTIEDKAPHKLSIHNLRAGLSAMNVMEEVVNRATIPTDVGDKQ
ncbi:uncharacterized protein Z520_11758 [Fonsecaea multimorphosa CBS 102226]|uniref:Uncharacterized protein n=1 Tax=Fonsecaea multimorphosa CBS 102226 TaxID=1442371 RepID=A0A0D2JHC5_9EURO|nr:uncharacterized protein Z520_11758 [Fonsecaea multimorphosa CBS 102226]KIX92582.1 hypothetical protein Z520_11758 [Fonsecaea multimorphosa CBS 102226]OAL17843.1 hypothetical protein AYO22_11270 [Fonsecaea multimorphosa]